MSIDESRVHIIRAAKTRHGPRERWAMEQWAQAAIIDVCGGSLPKSLNMARLVKNVNDHLRELPEYQATGYGEVTRTTVVNAWKKLKET
jgi:hypothetical protein